MLNNVMRLIRLVFTIGFIGSLILALSATAQVSAPDISEDTPLSEAELTQVFKGQTHRGSYNFIRRQMTTFSFEESTLSDGSIRHSQGTRIDTGKWSIKDTQICYLYDADDLNPACFEIYQRGNCYYHYQKSVRGTDREGFTARSVIKGEEPDCAPRIS